MFRIWGTCMLLRFCLLVGAQPLYCKEDAHCSEGYYCATREHVCSPCLQCQDVNRFVPEIYTMDTCIQYIESCGPCFEGFVNIYESHAKGKCVSPELLQFESNSYCVYVWMTAAITGSLVMVIFVYVIQNTFVFRIVPNYDLVATIAQSDNQVHVPTHCGTINENYFKNSHNSQ